MLDARKRGRQWRYKVRNSELERWWAVRDEVRDLLSTPLNVEWIWSHDGQQFNMEIPSFDFYVCLDSVSWAASL